EEIREIATSVDLELEASSHRDMDGNVNHAKASRQAIDHQIWREFLRLYQKFKETEDLTLLLEEYNQRLINRNKTVRVLNPKGEYEGTSLGIDAQGNLLVQKKDDSIVKVDSGEVSVRGVYGYV
ncbi:MAG TPA: biotin--[acetyl-CoA-carboxylase] ligase, partial [Lachnospiraceae bacterium]|nr:biotin--[acetyl-CoA-carboxylase] ligase [Lachnospiraceae bacterium]